VTTSAAAEGRFEVKIERKKKEKKKKVEAVGGIKVFISWDSWS